MKERVEVTDDVAEVERLHRRYYELWEQGDREQMLAMWLDSDDISCVHPGIRPHHGRQAVHQTVSEVLDYTRGVQFLFEGLRATVHGDHARVTCIEHILNLAELSLEDGPGLDVSRVATTNMFVRTPGGWRLWHHHAGPVVTDHDGLA